MPAENPSSNETFDLNGIGIPSGPDASLGDNLDQYLAMIIGETTPLAGSPNQINMMQMPKWNIYDPKQIYKHTNKLGNCVVPVNFGSIRMLFPGWHYANEDNEWGTSIDEDNSGDYTQSNVAGTTSSGTGVLTFETYQGKTRSHHLYRDLASGNYFYVVRKSPAHGHNPQSGLESVYYQKKYPTATIPDRAHEDAVIGSDDKWTKKYNPDYSQTCIVGVPNPHLSKQDFMNLVYPSYDNPMQRALALTSNPSSFLNETIDDTKYTPKQDFSSLVSAASMGKAQASGISSAFSKAQSAAKSTLGRDVQPLDPNFHVFRPVNLDAIATHPDMAAADIIGLSGGKYGHLQAWKLIEAYIHLGQANSCGVGAGMSASQYYSILNNVSPLKNLPNPNDPDYSKFQDENGHLIDLVALSIATGKSSFASTPLTKLKSLAPYQTSMSGYMFNRQYRYETLLFDYYADNSKFFSGKIDVTGRLGIEYGVRLLWYDERRQYVWEFYVDGVEHHWSVNGNGAPQPWITTIDVERGLPFTFAEANNSVYRDPATNNPYTYTQNIPNEEGVMDDRTQTYNATENGKEGGNGWIIGDFSKRFTGGYWGRQAIFVGGFFGEQTLASMISQANFRNKAYMSHFGNSGSASTSSGKSKSNSSSDSDIVSFARKYLGLTYVLGGNSHDIARGEPKSKCSGTDCNKFAWAVVTHCGYNGGPYPGNCANSISNLSKYKVSAGSTHAGSLLICDAHAMILEEKYHGNGTKIINEGPDKVWETTVGAEMEGVSRAGWSYFNLSKK